MTHICAETHFPHNLLKLWRDIHIYEIQFVCVLETRGQFKGRPFPSLSEEVAAHPSRCHAQVTDSLNHFRKLRVKWHPDTGMAMETDGSIASPWSSLHFLALSGARVCLPVGYGSDGRLSLSKFLPGKPPSIWKQRGRPPG